jgi:hypothetical protein
MTKRQQQAQQVQGTAWGLIATGDGPTTSDVSPSMNHKGDTIVYTTTDYSPDGHPDWTAKTAQVKTVAYNNRAGDTSQPLGGASDPAFLQYYPSYSADDKFIAFTRAPSGGPDGPYYNRAGEIMIVPAGGGTPTRLEANNPNACANDATVRPNGIINSWPKWSPDAFSAHGKTYYFVLFSSARVYGDEFSQPFDLPSNPLGAFKGLTHSSQLYLSAIVIDNTTGAMTTYPAVYLWNQNRTPNGNTHYSNLTPAWDPLQLPALVIPPVPDDIAQ